MKRNNSLIDRHDYPHFQSFHAYQGDGVDSEEDEREQSLLQSPNFSFLIESSLEAKSGPNIFSSFGHPSNDQIVDNKIMNPSAATIKLPKLESDKMVDQSFCGKKTEKMTIKVPKPLKSSQELVRSRPPDNVPVLC